MAALPDVDQVDAVLAVTLEDLVRLEDVIPHGHPLLLGHERVVAATQNHLGTTAGLVVDQLPGNVFPLEVARFLKFRNHESLFLLPFREMRNWNRKTIPFRFLLQGGAGGLAAGLG